MAKVTIRSETQIDEGDYEKILDFAEKSDKNPQLKNLAKLIKEIVEFNINNILAQIEAAAVLENAPATTTVNLVDAQGNPLIVPGGNGDDQTP